MKFRVVAMLAAANCIWGGVARGEPMRAAEVTTVTPSAHLASESAPTAASDEEARAAPTQPAPESAPTADSGAAADPLAMLDQFPRMGMPLLVLEYDHFPRISRGGARTADGGSRGYVEVLGGLPVGPGPTLFAAGIMYDVVRFQHPGTGGGLPCAPRLHHLNLKLAAVHPFMPGWEAGFFFLPGIASDFRGFRLADLRTSAGFWISRNWANRLVFGLGMLYSNALDLASFAPVVVLEHRLEWVRSHVFLPQDAEVMFTPGRFFEIGARFKLRGNRYRLHAEPGGVTRLNWKRATVGAAMRLYAWKGLHLLAEGGYAPFEEYRTRSTDGAGNRDYLHLGSWFAAASVGYLL